MCGPYRNARRGATRQMSAWRNFHADRRESAQRRVSRRPFWSLWPVGLLFTVSWRLRAPCRRTTGRVTPPLHASAMSSTHLLSRAHKHRCSSVRRASALIAQHSLSRTSSSLALPLLRPDRRPLRPPVVASTGCGAASFDRRPVRLQGRRRQPARRQGRLHRPPGTAFAPVTWNGTTPYQNGDRQQWGLQVRRLDRR